MSRCLLGERVRYDGQDKRYPWIAEELAGRVRLVGVCPEVEVGMPVPREPVRLEGEADAPRLRGLHSRRDWTCEMRHWAARRLVQLGVEDLDGFVLKARSPSCGLGDSELCDASGEPAGAVDGLFAAALRRAFPLLPLAREEDLQDETSREAFLFRCRAHRRWKDLVAAGFPERSLHGLQEEVAARLAPAAAERLRRAFGDAVGAGTTKEPAAWGRLLHELLEEALRA